MNWHGVEKTAANLAMDMWAGRVIKALQQRNPNYDATYTHDWIGVRDYCDVVTGGMWHADELDKLTDTVCARLGIGTKAETASTG